MSMAHDGIVAKEVVEHVDKFYDFLAECTRLPPCAAYNLIADCQQRYCRG